MKYYVTIEEMISQTFEVEAQDIDKAMDIAEQKYKSGEFILESGNLVCKQIAAEGNGECTEWIEF